MEQKKYMHTQGKSSLIQAGGVKHVFWRKALSRMRTNKLLISALVVGAVMAMLPAMVVNTKIAEADMTSILKAAFNGYSTSQNPGVAPRTTNTSADTIAAAAAAAYTFVCPDGQVESGRVEREGAIKCVPCPVGTVRMYVGGGEACHPPGYKADYSNIPAGYEVGANGQVCRSDGQSYAGSFNRRYKSTQPNIGECCNGGFRDSKPVVAGSSVALFICGGNNPAQTSPSGGSGGTSGQAGGSAGGSTGGSGGGGGSATGSPAPYTFVCPDGQVESGRVEREGAIKCVPCPVGTVRMYVGGGESCHPPGYKADYSNIPAGYEIGANGQICRADGQSYAGSFNRRYRSTQANIGECCNGGFRDSKPLVAGSSVALFICGVPTAAQAAAAGSVITPNGSIPGAGGSSAGGSSGSAAPAAVGSFDSASCTQFSGWALDTTNPSGSATVQFFVGGALRDNNAIGTTTTTVQRDDVNTSQRVSGVHGFNFSVPSGTFTPGQSYRVDAYLVGSTSQLIPGSPKTITCTTAGSGTPPPSPDNTYNGGPVDPNATLVISTPAESSVIGGTTVNVAYYSTVNVLPGDYAIFQLDAQVPVGVTTPGGTYQFKNVSAGRHVLKGYLVHTDGTKVPGTSTSRSFATTQ